MTDTHINSYAEAISAIAAAEGNTAAVENELFSFVRALQSSDELRATLSDPKLPLARRLQVVEDLLDGKATRTTVSFASMLVSVGRIGDLSAISEELANRAAAANGQTVAEVRSAVPLTDAQIAQLAQALRARTDIDVTVRNVVDPTVMGGIVTRIGDSVIDGSVRTRLNQLREAF